jgi:hypothetical protein
MDRTIVKKEKVIAEFREELNLKGIHNKKIYDDSFFKILNLIYKYHPRDIRCHIKNNDCLSFLVYNNHDYLYIGWLPNTKFDTIISFNKMDGSFDDSDINVLKLNNALEIIDEICKKMVQ